MRKHVLDAVDILFITPLRCGLSLSPARAKFSLRLSAAHNSFFVPGLGSYSGFIRNMELQF